MCLITKLFQFSKWNNDALSSWLFTLFLNDISLAACTNKEKLTDCSKTKNTLKIF